jgi:hypothetical protein
MQKTLTKTGWALVLASLFLIAPALAQPPLRPFPPLVPTPEYIRACDRIVHSYIQQGRQDLLVLARDNPDTTLGATCLLGAAGWSESDDEAIELLNRVIREYPQSRFELQARRGLLAKQATSPAQYLQAADALVSSYGAPSLNDILSNPTRAGDKFRALPPDYQRAFVQHYSSMTTNLRVQKRLEDSFAVALFGTDVIALIDPTCYNGFANSAHHTMLDVFGSNYASGPTKDPEVRVLRPRGQSGAGPRPRIRLEARQRSAGMPISLEKATFQLDGQDVKSEIRVLKHTINVQTKRPKHPFERLRLAYRPVQKLTPGLHLFTATIPVRDTQGIGQGTAQVQIRLNVRSPKDDDDDCERHDGDDWDD